MAEAPTEPTTNGVVAGETAEDEQASEDVKINGHKPHRSRTSSDPDAQEMVIDSLRTQIQDLFGQVTDLNNKLVKSYDRVSDLEDDLHVATSTVRASSMKISQLEMERTQHLSALNEGLLVEKSHVTAELTRLMEKATEEAAHRGQAESARRDIEQDLDDLSATLFGQANTMVAEARHARHISEQKLAHAETALKGAEEAVSMMQQQMQMLQTERETAEKEAEEARASMGKGKWVERGRTSNISKAIRLLGSHLPYQEFLLFVAHLRSVHLSSQQVPAMTTLLALPFLARMHTEDSETTIRLDLAPSLNWLSRRSVLAAIHNGQLVIEPVSSTLLQESLSSQSSIPGLASNGVLSCALCGLPVFPQPTDVSNSSSPSAPNPPAFVQTNSNSVSWSTALFRKTSQSSTNSQLTSPPSTQSLPPQVFIFRLAAASSTTATSTPPPLARTTTIGPSSSQPHHAEPHSSLSYSPNPSQSSTIYPLCSGGWCLTRLRATCILWAFARTGIVEKIWEEEVPILPPPTITSPVGEKPPVPPRRRGLWGMASALSWNESDKTKKADSQPPTPPSKQLEHPKKSLEEPKKPVEVLKKLEHIRKSVDEHRKLPPAPPPAPVQPAEPTPAVASTGLAPAVGLNPIKQSVPPVLPKRSEIRRAPTAPSPPPAQPGAALVSPPSSKPPSPNVPVHPPIRPPRRPLTPASVPLPDSRPHTPPIAGSPPTTSTMTPPPIPRRAAARVPRAPPAEGGSRSNTPAPSSPPPVGREKRLSALALTSTTAPTEDEEPKEEIQLPATLIEAGTPEQFKAEAEAAPEGPSSPSSDSEQMFDAKSNPSLENVVLSPLKEQVDKPTPVKAATNPEEERVVLVQQETKGEAEKAAMNQQAETEGVAGADDKTTKLQVVTGTDGHEAPSHSKADDEREIYVGDASWEERTWKEIVRLKEEMFWARIGAVKS